MSDKPVLIFLIATSRGLPILIHPFGESLQLRVEETIEGRYGSNPELEAMVLVRNLLYAHVDREIQEWISEKQFFPRFIASLAVFFVVFFFMAWTIRDVIPIVDELLVATVTALATYAFIGRRWQVSKPALEQKIILKKRVDTIPFTQSNFIIDLEKVFRALNDGSLGTADISEDYGRLLEEVTKEGCRQELEYLNEIIALSPHKKRRINKRISKNIFPELDRPEEQLYLLTQALRTGLSLPDSVRSQ